MGSDEQEPIAELINQVAMWKQLGRELQQELDESLLEWCREHGDFEVEDVMRFYAGKGSKVRALLPASEAMDVLFDAAGGDLEVFAQLLSTNAFKQGAAKALLGEDAWAQCWTKDPVLDELGEPVLELKRARL
ncbi:hypothetical protein DRQ53_15140 [bacterium]|nr:MAG: hypothetical protein DRQ53_15140 [bacterium]